MIDIVSESDHISTKKGGSMPTGTIIVLCVQILGGVWYAAQQSSSISQLKDQMLVQDVRFDRIDERERSMEQTLAVLKDRSDANLKITRRTDDDTRTLSR